MNDSPTSNRSWRRISLWVAAALLALAFLSTFIEISLDGRGRGTSYDLYALHQRDDLNVLFILVDTLRADRLGVYGYERETSPNIDKLAANGIRFARHHAQSSWTKASMASLWTGLNPKRTGILRFQHALPESATLPAEIMRDAGYRAFGIWRNGWVAPNFGFHQGFESYHNPRVSNLPAEVRQENPTLTVKATDFDIVDSTLTFLRSYRNDRWFLYLHMMDLHQYTYDDQSALFGTSYSDIYDNSIRRTDRMIGIIVQEIISLGLRDNTMIVLASDHGEAFGEHGHEGHARDIYAEVTTTPWIVSLPFRIEPGVVVEAPTANVDVWPTLLDLLKLPPLPEADGRSRFPEITGALANVEVETASSTRFAHLDTTWGRAGVEPAPVVSVAADGYRLIEWLEDSNRLQLFNIEEDPGERIDRIDDEPERAHALREHLDEYLSNDSPPWAPDEVPLDEMNLRQLRALGYQID